MQDKGFENHRGVRYSMNIKLIKVGTMPLPRGIAKKYIHDINKKTIRRWSISQQNLHEGDALDLGKRLAKIFGISSTQEGSLLAFKKVDPHDDDWNPVRSGYRYVAPGFLHVVLSGSCDLVVCSKRDSFKRGDVFLMNPNVTHEVTSKTLCMTYCWTVPLHQTLKKLK